MQNRDRSLIGRLQNSRYHNPRGWYNISDEREGVAEIFIYDVIGADWFGNGVTAAQFIQELNAVTAERIILRINSPGGDVNEGIAIRNALLQHPATLETHIDAAAYSTASWIGLAAEKVVMAPHATMMIHEPFDIVIGDAEDLRKSADVLDIFGREISKMYAERAGRKTGASWEKTIDQWRNKMRAETWYTDQGAVDAGLADEVAKEPGRAANTFDRSILSLYKNTPAELLDDIDQPARPEPTKRSCEDALRDAGLSRDAAKAVISQGWPALGTRDAAPAAINEELVRERLRFEAIRAGHMVNA